MGATNHTPYYNLPQFIGTDKPAWLTDVNGAFSDIDSAIKTVDTAAAQAAADAADATSAATGAASTANTLNTQINTPVTGLAAVVGDHTTAIGANASDIGDIKSAIGTTVLPTTAQTITGAIDENYNSIGSLETLAGNDPLITTAQTLTEAINELQNEIPVRESVSVTATSGEHYDNLMNRLNALIDFSKVTDLAVLVRKYSNHIYQFIPTDINKGASTAEFSNTRASSGGTETISFVIKSTASEYNDVLAKAADNTVTVRDYSANDCTGDTFTLYY